MYLLTFERNAVEMSSTEGVFDTFVSPQLTLQRIRLLQNVPYYKMVTWSCGHNGGVVFLFCGGKTFKI